MDSDILCYICVLVCIVINPKSKILKTSIRFLGLELGSLDSLEECRLYRFRRDYHFSGGSNL